MSDPRFSMDELDERMGGDAGTALEMGRWLEAAINETASELPAAATGFDAASEARADLTDRVMAALADEPAPTPAGFLLPLRRRGLVAGLGASVRQAWLAVGGGRPMRARAAALAYVAVVALAGVSITGAATIGAAGALGLLGPEATTTPLPTVPGPTPAPTSPSEVPSSAPSSQPVPSGSVEPSDDHGGSGSGSDDSSNSGSGSGSSGPGSSGSGSDDSSNSGSGSGSSGPGSSGSGSDDSSNSGSGSDSSGSGSGGSGSSPSPSVSPTPKPTQTPKPSETPH